MTGYELPDCQIKFELLHITYHVYLGLRSTYLVRGIALYQPSCYLIPCPTPEETSMLPLLLFFGLVLAGCGGGGESQPVTVPGPATPAPIAAPVIDVQKALRILFTHRCRLAQYDWWHGLS